MTEELKCPRCNGSSYVITVEGGMPGGAECPLCVGDGAPRDEDERAFVAALTAAQAKGGEHG